jgi:hypothetical protein
LLLQPPPASVGGTFVNWLISGNGVVPRVQLTNWVALFSLADNRTYTECPKLYNACMTVLDHQDSLLRTGLYGLCKRHNLAREKGKRISDKN